MIATDRKGVVLDSTLTASQARISPEVKHILTGILTEAIVKLHNEYFYLVSFGPNVRPENHLISRDLYCACALGANCVAVVAVKLYLRNGGEPAKTPLPGYFPACPHACPICGAKASYEPRLSSHHRGVGWQCSKYGTAHYWQHQGTLPRNACPA